MNKKIKLGILSLFLTTTLLASGFSVPKQDGFVKDITGTLSAEQEAKLEAFSAKLEAKTGDQVATLVVNSLGDDSVEDAAVKTFEKWGIGQKKKDNGVLFLIAVKDKKIRIEVGYGLEGTLPDGKTGEILDKAVIPFLKKGQFAEGIEAGHISIIKSIDPTISLQETPPQPHPVQRPVPLTTLQQIIIQNAFVLFIVLIIGLLIISPTFRAFLFLMLLSGRWGGGSGGGMGGGDSFGGFGGGSSGGGGSSRDW